jgi:hypothetical protein
MDSKDSNDVVELLEEDFAANEGQSSTSPGILYFTIMQLLENLHIIGLSSLEKWDTVMNKLKSSDEILSNPIFTQMFAICKHFHRLFYDHFNADPNMSQKTFEKLAYVDIEFEDLHSIWLSESEKQLFKDKMFSFDHIQHFSSIVRKILMLDDTEMKSNKSSLAKSLESSFKRKSLDDMKKCKKAKKETSSKSSSDQSSSSDESDDEDLFAKLFNKKHSSSLKISQQFQYNSANSRKRITTPGEKGSHLIKIEITDTRDLKSCKSEKFYWQKVNKKGYFLLNTTEQEDKEMLETLNEVSAKIGSRVSKIKMLNSNLLIFTMPKNENLLL